MFLPDGRSEIPELIRVGARASGSFGNGGEAAHAGKPIDVEGLDRPVRLDEDDGNHAAEEWS